MRGAGMVVGGGGGVEEAIYREREKVKIEV